MTTTTAPHPFYIPIRECESCDLHKTCTAPTPPVGNTQARVMFVGEAPGYREDLSGVPWTGPAGTLLNDLLASVNLERDHVWLTNTVKCRPPEDRDPNPREINTCRQWLDMEVDSIKPQIVVTLGGVAARAFGLRESMDHQHGIPVENVRYKGYTIPILLPVYHPAFGLHQTSRLRQIFDDFAVLGRLLQGVKPSELHVVDEYPNPTYREHPGAPPIGDQLVAVDAETIGLGGKLWSVQISDTPGTGTFIKASAVRIPNAIVHNYLYDARYIQMDKYADTMVMAWLLGLPQGLKTLALVRCGMKMQDLSDILRPHQVRLSLDYLEKAALIEWGKAPPYPATEWINKLGRVDTRTVNPRSINTKIATVIKNTIDKGENPWSKWKAIKPQERVVVESQMGLMQEASLADIPRDEAIYYSCRDPDATIRVYNSISPLIDMERMRYVFDHMEMPFQDVVLRMMKNGLPIDKDRLTAISKKLGTEMAEIAGYAADVAGAYVDGEPYLFNPASDTQVAQLVYEDIEDDYEPTKITPKLKRASVDEHELKKVRVLADGVTPDYGNWGTYDDDGSLHPVIQPILDYRERATIKATFADGMAQRAIYEESDWVLHSDLRTTAVETGRLAANDPNVLAFPARTATGRQIKTAVKARHRYLMVEGDYSQIEMRLVMDRSDCVAGIQLFRDGRDIHGETAVKIFGVSLDEARHPRYRNPTKRLGFGIVYMISARGLLEQLLAEGITEYTLKDCEHLIKEWETIYPEVRAYQRHQIEFARRHKYVEDMFGRRRYIPELMVSIPWIREAGERQAANMPIQSGAAGILKLALAKVANDYADDFNTPATAVRPGPISRWMLAVHDSAMWEIYQHMAFERAGDYKRAMESVITLQVPLEVDIKIGPTWGNMSEITL